MVGPRSADRFRGPKGGRRHSGRQPGEGQIQLGSLGARAMGTRWVWPQGPGRFLSAVKAVSFPGASTHEQCLFLSYLFFLNNYFLPVAGETGFPLRDTSEEYS